MDPIYFLRRYKLDKEIACGGEGVHEWRGWGLGSPLLPCRCRCAPSQLLVSSPNPLALGSTQASEAGKLTNALQLINLKPPSPG